MEVLVRVVESGSFTAAGNKLGVTTVMVGRQIRQLEEMLGMPLLQRNTRKQSLTDAGQLFYRSAKEILDNVARAQEAVQDIHLEPRGRLRIATPVTIGGTLIAPLVAAYQQRYPEVGIEMVLSNTTVNLIDDGFDLVIRGGILSDSGLVARPLQPYQNRICGSPTYLARAGVPAVWADLQHHRCLAHLSWHPTWRPTWLGNDGAELSWPSHEFFSCQ
jgi:DNA-binding transcriptional LysR family regulator